MMIATGIGLKPSLADANAPRPTATSPSAPIARKCKVTLLVPTWNEIVGMKAIMPLISRDWVDQILILDNGSTDGTVEWAKENGYEVHMQTKPGLRNAYMEVLPKVRGDVLLTFSPDGNSLPELIPDLVAKIDEGYDMVIASRYKPPARSTDDDFVTGFGNWFFTKSVNILHGGRYTDAMVIYRAYRTKLIHELELDQDRWYRTPEFLFGCRLPWEPLLSVRAALRKLKVAEIPGDEPARIGGIRKLRVLRWGASFYFQFIRDLLFWR
ncbi:MAG TPA: glycosyltransferase family 2 protein [Gemmata sp.]|nr:glycosyltransferase family 2 protein [Gemmata sp.]